MPRFGDRTSKGTWGNVGTQYVTAGGAAAGRVSKDGDDPPKPDPPKPETTPPKGDGTNWSGVRARYKNFYYGDLETGDRAYNNQQKFKEWKNNIYNAANAKGAKIVVKQGTSTIVVRKADAGNSTVITLDSRNRVEYARVTVSGFQVFPSAGI